MTPDLKQLQEPDDVTCVDCTEEQTGFQGDPDYYVRFCYRHAELGKKNSALLASHEALSAEVAGLRASLGAIMKLVGDGTLVRDISGDAEPGWAMKQLPLVMALKTAQELLDAARGQEKKDDR